MIVKNFSWEDIAGKSLIVFLSLGPIYWFGPLAPSIVKPITFIFLFIFFLIVFIGLTQKNISIKRLPAFNFIDLSLLFTFMFISSVVNDNFNSFFNRLFEFVFIYLLIKAMVLDRSIFSFIRRNIWKVGIPICLVSPIIVVNSLFGLPDWNSPFEVDGRFPPLSFVGFSGSRTGWSLAVSLLYPLLLVAGYPFFKERKYLVIISMLLFMAAVAVPSGRTGIAVCFLNTCLMFYIYFKNRIYSLVFGIICVISISIFFVANAELFRLSGILNGGGSISSGRYEGNLIAASLFLNSPIFGVGSIDLRNFGLDYAPVHNLWLNFAAEYGVVSLLLFVFIFIKFFIFSSISFKKFDWPEYGALLCVVNGLIFTLVEPGGILGQLKLQAVFWVSVGILLNITILTKSKS